LDTNPSTKNGLDGFKHIFNSLNLGKLNIQVKSKDLNYLVSHVNVDRLSNFPFVDFTKELVINIYEKALCS
jgi:hypothetical protein